jgi:hypothetical protein
VKRWALICLVLATPAMAHAGIDVSWNDCAGGGNESRNKHFVCTGTANESYYLPLYFKVPEALPNFIGMRMELELQNESGTPLSPFWHYESDGCQRPGSASLNGISIQDDIGAAPEGCRGFGDPWGGGSQGFPGIGAYLADYWRPGNGYFILGIAHSASFSLVPSVNYYACHLVFSNRYHTVCPGCTERLVLIWNSATLESGDGHPPLRLAFSDKFGDCVMFNGASPTNCDAVPTRNTTWGGIKSLYR